MKNKKIIILMCLILVFSITIIAACTDTNNSENEVDKNGANNNNQNVVPPQNPDQDIDLTERLLSDEEVLDGQIYLREEWAIGAIILKDEVSLERAEEIADDYAQQIKEKHSDKKVNVQVILNGENVANIEL